MPIHLIGIFPTFANGYLLRAKRTMESIHHINKVVVRNLQVEDYAQRIQPFTRARTDKDASWIHNIHSVNCISMDVCGTCVTDAMIYMN